MERRKAVWVMGIIIILLGVPSAYSLTGSPAIYGKDFFSAVEYLCNNVFLPIGSLLLSVFVGWFWLKPACNELVNGEEVNLVPRWLSLWIWCIRVVSPLGIAYIFFMGLKW